VPPWLGSCAGPVALAPEVPLSEPEGVALPDPEPELEPPATGAGAGPGVAGATGDDAGGVLAPGVGPLVVCVS
jgi:hypothetical protein